MSEMGSAHAATTGVGDLADWFGGVPAQHLTGARTAVTAMGQGAPGCGQALPGCARFIEATAAAATALTGYLDTVGRGFEAYSSAAAGCVDLYRHHDGVGRDAMTRALAAVPPELATPSS